MLDIMRKHAQSWGIKVMLGAIIVTFALFFGYSRFDRGSRGGQGEPVLEVNGQPISASLFDYFYTNTYERYRTAFQGQQAQEFLPQLVRTTTARQMIGREVGLQQADQLGIVIPDQEVAAAIKRAMTAQSGEAFDDHAYRTRFLPYFKGRFGLSYEDLVRQDLQLDAYEMIFAGVDNTSPLGTDPAATGDRARWTFEVVTIDPALLLEKKTIAQEGEAEAIAAGLSALPPKKWAGWLKEHGLEAKKVGPIRIAERERVMDGGTIEDWTAIFTLSDKKPVVAKPIKRGGVLTVVRLVEQATDDGAAASTPPESSFYQSWMSRLAANAKIKSYLEEKE